MEDPNTDKDLMEKSPRKLRAYCFLWLILCIFVLIVCAFLSKAAEEKHETKTDVDHMPRIYSVLVEGEPLAFRAKINRFRSIYYLFIRKLNKLSFI